MLMQQLIQRKILHDSTAILKYVPTSLTTKQKQQKNKKLRNENIISLFRQQLIQRKILHDSTALLKYVLTSLTTKKKAHKEINKSKRKLHSNIVIIFNESYQQQKTHQEIKN